MDCTETCRLARVTKAFAIHIIEARSVHMHSFMKWSLPSMACQ